MDSLSVKWEFVRVRIEFADLAKTKTNQEVYPQMEHSPIKAMILHLTKILI